MSETNQNNKSAAVAYLLWVFLGGLGAHRFYMGRIGSGFGMMALAVASLILSVFVIGLIGFPILFVWWVADAFLINRWLKEHGAPTAGAPVADTVSESPPATEREAA
jgi:TM2 domain-containing membrane protein YozV